MKTGKLQYRTININLKELIYKYSLENNINSTDYLIQVKVRAIQKQLAIKVSQKQIDEVSSSIDFTAAWNI